MSFPSPLPYTISVSWEPRALILVSSLIKACCQEQVSVGLSPWCVSPSPPGMPVAPSQAPEVLRPSSVQGVPFSISAHDQFPSCILSSSTTRALFTLSTGSVYHFHWNPFTSVSFLLKPALLAFCERHLILLIPGFCIFKFICNPQINTHRASWTCIWVLWRAHSQQRPEEVRSAF